jgi:dTDP-4-amino-4,6-dideoxygalactose transaminase
MIFKPIPRQKSSNTLHDLWRTICLAGTKRFLTGAYIKEFEARFAGVYGIKHALATGSCRSAFALILDALDIKSGDEVILPAFNMPAFPKILQCKGIKPVFIDINSQTLNMDERLIEPNITPKTKAIVAVHLFGNACPMDAILALARKHNLFVIEDCANAWETRYQSRYVGTWGDVSCFSLGATKDIPTFGGGMILTNDEELYARLTRIYEQQMRCPSWMSAMADLLKNTAMLVMSSGLFYGLLVFPVQFLCFWAGLDLMDYFIEEKDRPLKAVPRHKYTNFQAAVGIHKFTVSEQIQQRRLWNARIFNARFHQIPGVQIPQTAPEGEHTYWNYPILVPRRPVLIKKLLQHGISTKTLDTYNCNRLKIFRDALKHCPQAERIADMILILPVYHHLNETEINFIAEIFEKECQRFA